MSTAGADERKTVYRWGAITALGVVLGYAAVLLANARHFYTDDTESQYAPLWVMLGRHLRDGHLPLLIPEQWMTGNYTMEEAGLFNPPQLLIDLLAPSVDNLAVYATVVKLIFSIIAALGVYRVCLVYGGRAPWAAVAGIAFPLTGWFLFFDEASWMTSLTGTAWMLHAWAASVRYCRGGSDGPEGGSLRNHGGIRGRRHQHGRGGPIPVFVYLYLAISVEYVFPAVESALMLIAVAVGELVYQRKWQPVGRLTAVAVCAGLAGLLTYLPSMLSAKVSWRGTAQINNDQFLTVPWSESLNAGLPSALPAFNSWWGYIQPMPVTYIAWFLIPALAFVDWGRARAAWRELAAVALFAIMFLMWTAGPGTVGPLRWPARVLPMVAIGLLVLVCVLLGRFGTGANWRTRGVAALVLIGLLWVRTFSADPHHALWHVLSALVVAALGAGAVWLARNRGGAAAAALTIAAMFPIAFVQVYAAQPTPMGWNLPVSRSAAKAAFPDFPGVTLQLGDRGLVQPGERSLQGAYGSLVFGNYAKDLELNYVNGYTPNGHYWFGEMLCMRWDSSVCPDAFRRLFTPEPTTGRTLADLMKLDRVVLQRAMFPDAGAHPAPEGWTWVDQPGHERYIWVLERAGGPVSTVGGRVADAHDVTATSIAESDTSSTVRVSSATGGRVVFARLGWPGYRAHLNGRELPVTTVAKSFVAVDIPAGTQNAELEVTWRPPGWTIGIATAVVGLLGLGVLQWAHLRSRRPEDDDDPAATDAAADREPAEALS
ncbi:hypothetical protein NDR87_33440 [Nocardia sp. CDC159]|uniref:YfhO family protein n=1 Tax=Nocardia pulmonis TaxID=2951408 RepID=A0A9X2J1P1_9NOCA|nr:MULTISPECIES: hypothetical protein [Nocardia]MCM6778315.1 hypothetical protein [Nocardia pulmonis]MCM6791289.1 hypothetical protein [Nocardia sp. CDC159]